MKIRIFIYILLIFKFLVISGKETKYKVSDIPAELTKNAKAVIRLKEQVFRVNSINSATLKTTYVITVLNKNGIESSYFKEFHDKFIKINSINATIYDEDGNKVKHIPADKIYDFSAISGYSIYEDNRIIVIDPEYKNVPFTVEYSYENSFKGLLFYPTWSLYEDFNMAIEKSVFKIIVPQGFKFRYLEKNLPCTIQKSINKKNEIYTWEVANLKAIKEEQYCLPFEEYTPILYTAPSDFKMDAYLGNCDTWVNFGNWVNNLNKDRNILSEETKSKILELIKDEKNEYEKIKTLYNFLQNKTRYVSIQVGIGGWQPFPAETVDRLSYGDCKALTNYMKSILEIAGIKSNYTLIYAGEDAPRINSNFPSGHFNHAFLCVPLEKDTIWLECTDQLNPFGYQGTFTDDRDVLLIEENNSRIVHTKIYTTDENQHITVANVDIDLQGFSEAIIKSIYKGFFYWNMEGIMQSDDQDRKKKIYNKISIPSFELVSYNLKQNKHRIPWVDVLLNLTLNNYCNIMGNRMILPLNLMNKMPNPPKKNEERQSDIFLRRAYIEIDTIIYQIPDVYMVEKLPENKAIQSPFGEYHCNITMSNKNELVYIRFLKMKKGQFPLSMYNDFIEFISNINVADDYKAILIKKN